MKILFVATVRSHIGQFHMPFIRALKKEGYEVHAAYKDNSADKPGLDLTGIDKVFEIPFERSPFSTKNIRAYRELEKVIEAEHYDIIHCHTPMGGVVTRFAARKSRKQGTRVFYTAHGFHFYKGAPLKNWLFYYPVEKLCAHWTDVLITINTEDYELAKKKFHSKRTEYVPGVGIDISKFSICAQSEDNRKELREALGISEKDKMLFSVGELNRNKNHRAVVQAMANLHDPSLHYVIAGVGELHDEILGLAKTSGVEKNVHLLGYRRDIAQFYHAADVYIQPSIREGLPVALMEAIASKIPVICSRIRGNTDLVDPNQTFDPHDVAGLSALITEVLESDYTEIIDNNYERLRHFDIAEVILEEITLYKMK